MVAYRDDNRYQFSASKIIAFGYNFSGIPITVETWTSPIDLIFTTLGESHTFDGPTYNREDLQFEFRYTNHPIPTLVNEHDPQSPIFFDLTTSKISVTPTA